MPPGVIFPSMKFCVDNMLANRGKWKQVADGVMSMPAKLERFESKAPELRDERRDPAFESMIESEFESIIESHIGEGEDKDKDEGVSDHSDSGTMGLVDPKLVPKLSL